MTHPSLPGLTVSAAPKPQRRAPTADRGPEARAALLASAIKRCRAIAAQLADDEAWCCGVEARLNDPAFARIPPDDPTRRQAREEVRQVRLRIAEHEAEFAHWRQKADQVWEEMGVPERLAAIGGLGTEGWAMWFHLGSVLIGEYERVATD